MGASPLLIKILIKAILCEMHTICISYRVLADTVVAIVQLKEQPLLKVCWPSCNSSKSFHLGSWHDITNFVF